MKKDLVNNVNSEGHIVPANGGYQYYEGYVYSKHSSTYHIDDELKFMNILKSLDSIKRHCASNSQQGIIKQGHSDMYEMAELEFKLNRFAFEELKQWSYEEDEGERSTLEASEKRFEKIAKYIQILEQLKGEEYNPERKKTAIFMNNNRTMSVHGNVILYSK
jgi:hypothetical protein